MAPDEAIITSYLVVLRISGSLSSDDHGHIAHVRHNLYVLTFQRLNLTFAI